MILTFLNNKTLRVIISLIFILFMLVVLPLIQSLNPHAWPDTMLFYSSDRFYGLIESYGHEQRSLYIILRWTFDLVYPLVYGLYFLTWILYLSQKKTLLIYPLLGIGFDYIENILATVTVGMYPKELPFLVYLMQGFSLLKWLFLLISICILIFLVYRRFKHD